MWSCPETGQQTEQQKQTRACPCANIKVKCDGSSLALGELVPLLNNSPGFQDCWWSAYYLSLGTSDQLPPIVWLSGLLVVAWKGSNVEVPYCPFGAREVCGCQAFYIMFSSQAVVCRKP